jgi:pyruvate/2-oxoglutarate/acetoin dehydrogenase E1 component/TPP-dependent pyruvate/acetoin dehydrogenase alpha subunit
MTAETTGDAVAMRGLCLSLYTTMARIAAADKAIQRGLSAGELQFQYYPAGGQEAIPAGICSVLNPDDYVVATYRVIHDIVAKGTPLNEIMAEMYGRQAGSCKGKGGPMHMSDPQSGLMVTTGIVGGGIPIASGLALGEQMKGSGKVVVVNFGDGATSIGAFHEGLIMASIWKLPVVFVCQNNQYAEYTAIDEYTLTRDFSKRAAAYEMPGIRVDGTDPLAVREAARQAIERARRGEGPTLIEAYCERLQGHAFGSDEGHMDKERLRAAKAVAPVPKFRKRLLDEGLATEVELAAIDASARREVDEAMAYAKASPLPPAEEVYLDVFGDPTALPPGEGPGSGSHGKAETLPATERMITFSQAVNEALAIALETDPRVFLMGEDIADPAGGVLKTTAGLSTRFGRDRVRPTPIAETGIIGAAIGAAMAGMRPVPEIMINDFLMVAMDQLANHAAKLRYMSGGRTNVPLTIRTVSAGFVGSFGAQHSQSLESWLAHSPGLKVVYPSTAADAKGLLLSCIWDEDPCVFFEAARVYFNPGPVPEGDYRIPLGVADVKRAGSDLTIVSYGWPVIEALGVAEQMAKEGISIEVVDLRSIVPLDLETVLASVRKTGRALVVHAGVGFSGFGAELAAQIHQHLHGALKAPVGRVCGRYTPIPFSQGIESLHFPTGERIADGVRAVLGR